MKVSIITVVYNNERTIEFAIQSVLSQTYENIEYIIIDGNSKDNTNNIIAKYKDQITHYVSEPDLGIYDAMNKGILRASGDVIGILNSDDFYNDNNVIETVMTHFKSDSELKLLYGDLVYVSALNTDKVVRKWKTKAYNEFFFEYGNVPPHPALFVKKEVYDQCGYFNLGYRLAADYDFMLRAFKMHGAFSLYLPQLMVRMRLGGATNKNLKNIINGNVEIIRSWKENKFKIPFLLMPLRIFKRLTQFI